MGWCKCEIHGGNGIWVLCEHAIAEAEAGVLGPVHSTPYFSLCEACFHGLPSLRSIENVTMDELRDSPELQSTAAEASALFRKRIHPLCGMCFDDALLAGTRARGEPDPFEVYDRTLWPIHHAELEELRRHLLALLELPAGHDGQPALYVIGGSRRAPTQIEVHGMHEIVEQTRVIEAVRAFFRGRERPQARVVFREAWQTRGPVGRRGALLREEDLS